VIVRSPPVEVSLKVRSLEGCRPRASSQSGHTTTDRQIDPLDKGRVHSAREAEPLQSSCEGEPCPQPDHLPDVNQFAPPRAFGDLSIEQTCCYLPLGLCPPPMIPLEPLPKVGCERVERGSEAIAGENRQAIRSQLLPQRVDEEPGHVMRTGTQLEDGNALAQRINGHPEPQCMTSLPRKKVSFPAS